MMIEYEIYNSIEHGKGWRERVRGKLWARMKVFGNGNKDYINIL